MKILQIIIILLQISLLYAKSESDKTGKIIIDGNTSDFNVEPDQLLLSPDLSGRYYESDTDSKWGVYVDISKIKLTWDSQYLYIGADGIIDLNNIIIYIDTGQGLGVSTVSDLSDWKRRINFVNVKPDFFLACNDNNAFPVFWKINIGNKTSEINTASTFNDKSLNGIDARIPWSTLYSLGAGRVAAGAALRIVGTVTGGDDSSAPDSVPDSSKELPCDSTIFSVVDNCIIIPVDADNNGYPDMGIDIRSVCSIVIDVTSLKNQPLDIQEFIIKNHAFTPNNDGINDELEIKYYLTKDAIGSARVFNSSGDIVYTLQDNIELTAGYQVLKWDGYNNNNIKAKPGLYLIHFEVVGWGASVVKKVGVYLVN